MKDVFFTCVNEDAPAIEVYVNDELVASTCVVEDLVDAFKENDITSADNLMCSSSIDFCEEYAFDVNQARDIIVAALREVA